MFGFVSCTESTRNSRGFRLLAAMAQTLPTMGRFVGSKGAANCTSAASVPGLIIGRSVSLLSGVITVMTYSSLGEKSRSASIFSIDVDTYARRPP